MVTNGKKWHCLEVKRLPRLLQRITLNNNVDYYCKICLSLFRTESKLKLHENVCKNHDYCYMIMSEEVNGILKCNNGKKSLKNP